ncbi:MAG: flagellar export chaperone FliS [Phycisphaerae bacterium]|nr:flagellar export chaperone FliS [Phycisphaerae bacterium]
MTQTASRNPAQEYLRMKVMTASAEQLQMMLYDGAVRFARQGREAIAAANIEAACEKLLRAQKIVLELRASLRRDIQPALADTLDSLYAYIYRRLMESNLRRDAAAADEAIALLEYQRQTWQLVMEKLHAAAVTPVNAVQPAANVNLAV